MDLESPDTLYAAAYSGGGRLMDLTAATGQCDLQDDGWRRTWKKLTKGCRMRTAERPAHRTGHLPQGSNIVMRCTA